MSTTLPHGIIQINEGNISWYGDITANWQLIDSKIGVYDAAIATIPAPANNGTLTINYGGTTIAMFGADDAGNVTADIPAPGDGTLTVTQGGSTIGSFSANQATPETVDIPAPGDGTLTIQLNGTDVQTFTANQSGNATANIVTPAINNGTLTIRLNGVDVQTFTANQANDVVADIIPPVPGDGTLTIKVNGSTAGTFTANQSTAATANITVPTAVSELTNDSGYLTSSSNLDASKLTSGTVDIERLPQGALERLVKVANEAARYALTTADVQLGDTVQQLDTGIMYVVTDIGHLDSAAGYTEYTAGTAASVPWSGVTGKPTFAAVATSGAYSDLTGTPTIPTVNNGTLTIQQNGTTVDTFTANSSTDKTVNISVPTKTSDLTNDSGFITGVTWNDVSNKPSFATVATSGSYNDLSNKPTIPTVNNATLTIKKNGTTVKTFTANASSNVTANITVPTKTSDLTNDSGFITSDNTKIPLAGSNQISGSLIPATTNAYELGGSQYQWNNAYIKSLTINGATMITGYRLVQTDNTGEFLLCGGTEWSDGGFISLCGANFTGRANNVTFGAGAKRMNLYPEGTWTWDGTACQIISDQRLKQQISQIDDKLLNAWEDVDLVQFKYNDAVDAKKDKARLHTGYVVQQIDKACKEHGVDISEYGLYCHEEYPEETEEVEVEQADGTKVKERKVIREASEHYSLRYTEVYAVECMYLRRCIRQLTARIEELEKGKEQGASK